MHLFMRSWPVNETGLLMGNLGAGDCLIFAVVAVLKDLGVEGGWNSLGLRKLQ